MPTMFVKPFFHTVGALPGATFQMRALPGLYGHPVSSPTRYEPSGSETTDVGTDCCATTDISPDGASSASAGPVLPMPVVSATDGNWTTTRFAVVPCSRPRPSRDGSRLAILRHGT